jgi:hypothetical protein
MFKRSNCPSSGLPKASKGTAGGSVCSGTLPVKRLQTRGLKSGEVGRGGGGHLGVRPIQ